MLRYLAAPLLAAVLFAPGPVEAHHCKGGHANDPGCDGGGGGPTPKTVFITSGTYTGNLGGAAGADATCQALADAAGLSGVYLAWLADGLGSSPAADFTQSVDPYVRIDGVTIAANWADLTDDTILHAIEVDEQGGRPRSVGKGAIIEVWTGTTGNGALRDASATCNNWGSGGASDYGTGGDSANVFNATPGDAPWASGYGGIGASGWTCDRQKRFYCFEQ